MRRFAAVVVLLCGSSLRAGGLAAKMLPSAGDAWSPRAGGKATHAPNSRTVEKRVASYLKKRFESDGPFNMDDFNLSYVKLKPAGPTVIWVTGPDGSCGATGNCPLWIFDRRSGAVMVDDYGWDSGFRKTIHHGVYDFYIRANMSCCTGTLNEYRFDGTRYKLARSVEETTE